MTETLIRYTEIYPAKISPLPPGVPPGMKYKVIITDKWLTVAWLAGTIQRVDIALEPGAVGPEVTFAGGDVQAGTVTYAVERNPACGLCGGGTRMLGWDPWPGAHYIEEPRKNIELLQRTGNNRPKDGLIPQRYSRR